MARVRRSMLAATVAISVFAVDFAAHASCPAARALRVTGRAAAAEAAARACLADDAEDVETWVELSRAVGYQRRFDEALHWADRSLERYPGDADIAVWRVRLLAWSGRLPVAHAAFAALVARSPAALDDPETAMLQVDLDFWGRDWVAATDGFTAYLARFPDDAEALRKRGLAWRERGDGARAVADLERSCSLGDRTSCLAADDVERRDARVSVRLEPGFVHEALADEVSTRLEALVRVAGELQLGLAGEVRLRGAGAGFAEDTLSTFLASWRTTGFALAGAVGIGPGAEFSPRLNTWIEPSLELLSDRLWAHLRLWRLSFADAGAYIVSPALDATFGPVNVELRYFLALEDGGDATHSVVARVRWAVARGLELELGGGGGDATDSLSQPTAGPRGHGLVMAGVTWEPVWRHAVGLHYALRLERAGARAADRHELALSYRVLF